MAVPRTINYPTAPAKPSVGLQRKKKVYLLLLRVALWHAFAHLKVEKDTRGVVT